MGVNFTKPTPSAAGLTVFSYTENTTMSEEDSFNASVTNNAGVGGATIKVTGSTTEVGGEVHLSNNGSPDFFGCRLQTIPGEVFVFADGTTMDDTDSIESTTNGDYLMVRQTSISPVRWTVVQVFGDWHKNSDDAPLPQPPISSNLVTSTFVKYAIATSATLGSAANTLQYSESENVVLTLDATTQNEGDKITFYHGSLSHSQGITIKPGADTIVVPNHETDSVGTSGVKSILMGSSLTVMLVDSAPRTWKIIDVEGEWQDIDSEAPLVSAFSNTARTTAATSIFVDVGDSTVYTSSASAVSVRLEDEIHMVGRRVTIKKVGAAANNITVSSENAVDVEFGSDYQFTAVHGCVTFEYAPSGEWVLISKSF